MEAHKIHLIIADDHQLFIDGLKRLLSDEADIAVDDVAADGRELLSLLQQQRPDIILLDINMPRLNGLEAIRIIKQQSIPVKIIVLSTYSDEHLVEKAKGSGANGYLLKNCSKAELLQTIRLVSSGHTSFPYREPTHENEFTANDHFLKQFNLTKRELEIVQLIKENFTNQQIADKLYLSIHTVETHRKNIMQKLELTGPAALMKFILENNL